MKEEQFKKSTVLHMRLAEYLLLSIILYIYHSTLAHMFEYLCFT